MMTSWTRRTVVGGALQAVVAKLGDLPLPAQITVPLFFYHGLVPREIGQLFGVPANMVTPVVELAALVARDELTRYSPGLRLRRNGRSRGCGTPAAAGTAGGASGWPAPAWHADTNRPR
jgi:hypothetical protein